MNRLRSCLRMLAIPAAVCTGAVLYGLAFPPFDQAWLAWFALVPLLLLAHGRPCKQAFLLGAVYGVACTCATGQSWFPQALARFFDLPIAVGVGGLAAYGILFCAVPFGIFAAGAARLRRSAGPVLASLGVAALWVATELLRGRVFQQPWVILGYSQHAHTALIQVSAVTAVYGVSFLLALGNAAMAEVIVGRGGPGIMKRLRPLAVAGALTIAAWVGGDLVLQHGLPPATQLVAVVQTNVPPALHWTRAYTDRQIVEHTRATEELVPTHDVALIVWPENAVPRYLELEPGLAAHLAALAARHGSDLLFGSPRYAAGRSYNSVQLITAAGHNGGHYDKQRLVFVAESNPLRAASSDDPGDNPHQFTAGDGAGVLPSFVPLGVSVCHEVLFPELAARSVRAGAALLISVSNDGWLDPGNGVASRQHFAMATFRAVETRRYLVRAATTGISGVIDPLGRVVASLDVGVRGALVTPVSGLSGLTPHVCLGDVFALGCVVLAVALLVGRSSFARLRWLPAMARRTLGS
jgi:apolipoprotein N-acyltransferase